MVLRVLPLQRCCLLRNPVDLALERLHLILLTDSLVLGRGGVSLRTAGDLVRIRIHMSFAITV